MVDSGATFERVMELALKGLQWQTGIIYIDDCIVFGQTFDDHMIRLKEVLDIFRQVNLKLKPRNANWSKQRLLFLVIGLLNMVSNQIHELFLKY